MRWFKEVFLNFRRSGFMSLISAGTITITVVMLGSYYLLNENLNYFIKKVENRVELTVFLHDGAKEEMVNNFVEKTLIGFPKRLKMCPGLELIMIYRPDCSPLGILSQ